MNANPNKYGLSYPYNLIDAIFGHNEDYNIGELPEDRVNNFYIAYTSAARRDPVAAIIVNGQYAFNRSNEEIAESLGLTEDEVHERSARFLRMMRHPSKSKLFTPTIGMTEDCLKHSIGVARQMRRFALADNDKSYLAYDAFVVGLLHDIGYEFDTKDNHEMVAGKRLKNMGFPYAYEIMYHNSLWEDIPEEAKIDFDADVFFWLQKADMTVDSHGNIVTFEERLEDIANRYGEDSEIYKHCEEIIKRLY